MVRNGNAARTTTSAGKLLGIEGPEEARADLKTIQPEFTLKAVATMCSSAGTGARLARRSTCANSKWIATTAKAAVARDGQHARLQRHRPVAGHADEVDVLGDLPCRRRQVGQWSNRSASSSVGSARKLSAVSFQPSAQGRRASAAFILHAASKGLFTAKPGRFNTCVAVSYRLSAFSFEVTTSTSV